MIVLKAHDLSWIGGKTDNPNDQCTHGTVEFQVNNTIFVTPEDGSWILSAAGLYLLRTLSFDHEPGDAVTQYNFLFPCCGFTVFPNVKTSEFKALCMGCATGIDVSVRHVDTGMVELSLGEKKEVVTKKEWRSAVLTFAAQITDFYASSAPKAEVDDAHEREGWAALWQEWRERVEAAASKVSIFAT